LELHGNIDFLANCGGLLSLCMGISVLSLLEIIYFCLIHLKKCGPTSFGETIFVEEFGRRSRRRHFEVVKQLMTDYFNKTTLDGVKYVATSSLSLMERIWWLVVVGTSIFCCGALISDVFWRYDQSPVTVSSANEETPISQV
jgi:Amiloride-sensitive sodium channel